MCQSNTLQGPDLHTGKWWDAIKLYLTLRPRATTSTKLKFMSGGCVQGTAAAAAVPGTSTHNWTVQARLALPVVHQIGELVSGTVWCFLLCENGDWTEKRGEGGREGFWAEGATAICKAFVWPNYYKAPYALNWQRRACCYMTRGTRRGFFFSFPLFSITRRTEKIAKGLLWNQAKAVWSLRALERAARMQLCRDWSRSDCSEGGESSGRGSGTSAWCCQHGSGPASPRADRRLTGGEDRRKNMKCSFLFPCWVSPTSCWESRLYLCWDSTSSP